MIEKKFLAGVVIFVLVAVIGGYFVASNIGNSAQVKYNSQAKVEVADTYFDWGKIGLNKGNVEKTFEIKSSGKESLTLSNLSTSCMCTTAQLIFEGKTSPVFGMHNQSEYSLEVPPRKSAKLKVVFDPAFHGPSGIGPINRQVTVKTNDSDSPELNFMLTAMVER